MALFPMFLKLEGRSCLVVGAGNIGEPKIRSLLVAGASVRVIAPHARQVVRHWARTGLITWEARPFHASDLEDVFLVIVATTSPELNQSIFDEAQRRNILCNAVDDPRRCDFYFPAVVRRGQLQIAISTGGQSPALAQRLRRELESQFPAEYAGWLEALGESRRNLLARNLDVNQRRELLHSLASRHAFDQRQRARHKIKRQQNGAFHER
jgi:precorrin-2 dehydrogenase/sirohydrochlorin ferrochelatase